MQQSFDQVKQNVAHGYQCPLTWSGMPSVRPEWVRAIMPRTLATWLAVTSLTPYWIIMFLHSSGLERHKTQTGKYWLSSIIFNIHVNKATIKTAWGADLSKCQKNKNKTDLKPSSSCKTFTRFVSSMCDTRQWKYMMYDMRFYFWYSISHTAVTGILVSTFIISQHIFHYILHVYTTLKKRDRCEYSLKAFSKTVPSTEAIANFLHEFCKRTLHDGLS